MFTASVVIPAHNSSLTIGRQLDALASQHHAPSFEVIVVANCCSDDTVSVVRSYNDRLVLTVIEANDKPSAAYARNAGARMATGTYLLFCDADDCVSEDWVVGLLEPLEEGRADFVGTFLLPSESAPNTKRRSRPKARSRRTYRVTLPYIITASLGVRSVDFWTIDGFDESFPGAGGEDNDFSWRMLRAGFRIGAAPKARLHYERRTGFRATVQHQRSRTRGHVLLGLKEGSLPEHPSIRIAARSIVAQVVYLILHPRSIRPVAVYLAVTIPVFYYREHWRLLHHEGVSAAAPPEFCDFAVRQATPLIEGLAFVCRTNPLAHWNRTVGLDSNIIRVAQDTLVLGGRCLEIGADIGVMTVVIAKIVGATGQVVAVESDDINRRIVERNLIRHRVVEQVRILESIEAIEPDAEFESIFIGEHLCDIRQVVPLLASLKRVLDRTPQISVMFTLDSSSLTRSRSIDALLELFPATSWSAQAVDHVSPRRSDLAEVITGAQAASTTVLITKRSSSSPEEMASRS